MTNHAGRLYATAVALLALFLTWAVVAAHPWVSASASPQLTLLALREQALRREAALVNTIVRQRAAAAKQAQQIAARTRAQASAAASISASAPAPVYASAPAAASAAPAPAPAAAVRVVTLPPLTVTKTS